MISVAFMILVMVFMLTGGADPLGQARAGVAIGADGGEGGEEGGADLILQIYIMLQIYQQMSMENIFSKEQGGIYDMNTCCWN